MKIKSWTVPSRISCTSIVNINLNEKISISIKKSFVSLKKNIGYVLQDFAASANQVYKRFVRVWNENLLVEILLIIS